MLGFVVFLAVFGCAFAGTTITPKKLDGRIAGGIETTIEQHPYSVSLQTYIDGRHLCGGSLLRKDIVITAAHCVNGWEYIDLYVRMGTTNHSSEYDGVDRNVDTYFIHPGYNEFTFVSDIALIRLTEEVLESEKIQYIPLSYYTPEAGTQAVATGWGAVCDYWCLPAVYMLREVTLNIIDWKTCGSYEYNYGDLVKKNMLCAAARGKDACFGDSGGPLVIDGELVGTVSWGNGCAEEIYPGVYVDVSRYRNWIETAATGLQNGPRNSKK